MQVMQLYKLRYLIHVLNLQDISSYKAGKMITLSRLVYMRVLLSYLKRVVL